MSFYFVILGPADNPLYEAEFGTYKQGGDGVARFPDEQRHLNPFLAHSSLDLIEDLQWSPNPHINHIPTHTLSLPLTLPIPSLSASTSGTLSSAGTPSPASPAPSSAVTALGGAGGGTGNMYIKCIERFSVPGVAGGGAVWVSVFITPGNVRMVLLHDVRMDEGVRQFFWDVWELYVKTLMNPFYKVGGEVRSRVFDGRVRAAGKKYL
ncbi:Sedlin [Kalaharituber pfeilii]|nr:Sedlin [Kalaharituber pfeilii]